MNAVSLVLPWPPSVNRYWRHVNGRVLISKAGREYRKAVAAACRGVRGLGCARLGVNVVLQPPDRCRRDIDNILKSLLDALEHAGVYDDDGQIDRLMVHRLSAPCRGGAAHVSIEALE